MDFNLITSLEENKGGIRWLDYDSIHFHELIQDMHLVYLNTNNNIWTRNNRQ